MMRRAMLCCTSLAVVASMVQTARGDDLADVRRKIESKAKACQSIRQEARMTMDMPGPSGKMTGDTAMEFVRRGKDKWLSRVETTMKMPKQAGQPGPEQMKIIAICDGQYVYSITEQAGRKMALKTRIDQGGQQAPTEPTGFVEMEKHYDLKRLPDEKVDGKAVWVIEARPKAGQPEAGFDRQRLYYDQSNGVAIRMLAYDKAGTVVTTMEVTKVEVDVKIPEDRFALPPGVQVVDMAQAAPSPASQETPAASGADDPDKSQAAPDAPAKDKSDSDGEKPPAGKEPSQSAPRKSDKAKGIIKKLF